MPANTLDPPLDAVGLGQSITWALDQTACYAILPKVREIYWGISLVGCAELRQAIARGFDAWAQNHPAISFTDVSALCEVDTWQEGLEQHINGCGHAELWVTWRDAVSAYQLLAAGGDVTNIWPQDVFVNAFPNVRISNSCLLYTSPSPRDS